MPANVSNILCEFLDSSLAPPISRDNSNKNEEIFKAVLARPVIVLRLAEKPGGSMTGTAEDYEDGKLNKDVRNGRYCSSLPKDELKPSPHPFIVSMRLRTICMRDSRRER
jgi:hypothetical protein